MEAETTEQAFTAEIAVCALCKVSLQGKNPHLLVCLHSICKSCLTDDGNGQERADHFTCPLCQQVSKRSDVIENQLVELIEIPGSGDGSDKKEEKICTGCEENVAATSYCLQCAEFLCEQCVTAHKRVKITKDHTVQPKDSVSAEETTSGKQQLCPVHLNEPLKLFCKNCDMLTCRDCQLLNHKEHKYQFVNEAAVSYKNYLTTLTEKVREKQAYVQNAKQLIDNRNQEILDREANVTKDIKLFALKCIKEINQRGRNILADLTAICSVKKAQLDQKNKEITNISNKLDHALKFTQFALDKGGDEAILYTKKVLLHQLSNILKSRCEVPNPNHVVDIRFAWDTNLVSTILPKQGVILVDGVPYTGLHRSPNSNSGGGSESSRGNGSSRHHGSSSSSSSSAMPKQPPGMLPQPHMATQQPFPMGNFRLPGNVNFAELNNEQKHLVLMKMRHMHEQQRRHRSHPGAPAASGSPTANMSAPHFPPARQLPNQSSAISSSMMQQHHHQQQQQHQQHGYYPSPSSLMVGKSLTNLAQLQQQQQQQQQQHQQQHVNRSRGYPPPSSSTALSPSGPTPSPIVIQPVDLQNQMGFKTSSPPNVASSSRSSPHGSNSPSPGVGSTTLVHPPRQGSPGERPSCSFAKSRQEAGGAGGAGGGRDGAGGPKSDTDLFSDFNLGEFNFDDDPLAILESLKKDNDPLTADSLLDLSKQPSSPGADTTKQEQRSSCRFSRNAPPQTIDLSNVDSLGFSLDTPPPMSTGSSSSSSSTPKPSGSAAAHDGGGSGSGSDDQSLPLSQGKVITPRGTDQSHHSHVTGARENPDDPSEDWCAVCHNGGDLLCCDYCPKVFHLRCHVPILTDFPKEDEKWRCRLCQPEEELRLEAADKRESSAGGMKRRAASGLTDKETKTSQRILLELLGHEGSTPFHEPVDRSVPNYYMIIQHPIDFSIIKRRLTKNSSNHYQSVNNFLADVKQVFANCVLYNHPDSEVAHVGVMVENFFKELVHRYLPYIDLDGVIPTGSVIAPDDGSRDSRQEKKRKRKTDRSFDRLAHDRIVTAGDDESSRSPAPTNPSPAPTNPSPAPTNPSPAPTNPSPAPSNASPALEGEPGSASGSPHPAPVEVEPHDKEANKEGGKYDGETDEEPQEKEAGEKPEAVEEETREKENQSEAVKEAEEEKRQEKRKKMEDEEEEESPKRKKLDEEPEKVDVIEPAKVDAIEPEKDNANEPEKVDAIQPEKVNVIEPEKVNDIEPEKEKETVDGIELELNEEAKGPDKSDDVLHIF